jgi:hypothetical protein
MLQKVKLSTLVANQFPEFIQEEYPALTSFIEAYYKFLEQTNARNLSSYRDIDETLDAFIVHFKNELNYNGFYTAPENDRFILKKIKEIYSAKGSEESYRLLFKLLFNKDVEIYYPYKSVLRASDGKWNQDNSLFIVPTSGDINQIVSKTIKVISEKNRITYVVVKKIKKINDSLYEVFIENNKYLKNITVTSTIEYNGFIGSISPTIGTYEVLNPGLGFKVGELLTINTNTSNGMTSTTIKVDKIDANGGIKRISFIKFGNGYTYDFYGNVQSKFTGAPDSIISISKNNINLLSLPSKTSTLGFIDEGYIATCNYWDLDYADNTYVGDIVQTFRTEVAYTLDSTSDNTNNIPLEQKMALIRFNLSPIAKYQGYYINNDGFISDAIYIENQDYYQPYAYQIKIDEALNSYKNIIKSYLHTAGTKLFAEYQLNNVINLSTEIKSLINYQLIQFIDTVDPNDENVKDLIKSANDSIITSDSVGVALEKPLFDDTAILDSNSILTEKPIKDSIISSDSNTLDTSRKIIDLITANDSNTNDISKEVIELVESNETSIVNISKPIFDQITINDSNTNNTFKEVIDLVESNDNDTKDYKLNYNDNVKALSLYLYNIDNYAEDGYFAIDEESITIAVSTSLSLSEDVIINDQESITNFKSLSLSEDVIINDQESITNFKSLSLSDGLTVNDQLI